MMMTTLRAIRLHSPCEDGWRKLLAHRGKTQADDEPLSLLDILESNGLDDAIWCLRAVEGHDREARLYAVWCARQVQHLMTDPRSVAALDVAEGYANGEASESELIAARDAARNATRNAACNAWRSDREDAAHHASRSASEATEWVITQSVAWSAWNAWDAARAATNSVIWAAVQDAVRDAQRLQFIKLVS